MAGTPALCLRCLQPCLPTLASPSQKSERLLQPGGCQARPPHHPCPSWLVGCPSNFPPHPRLVGLGAPPSSHGPRPPPRPGARCQPLCPSGPARPKNVPTSYSRRPLLGPCPLRRGLRLRPRLPDLLAEHPDGRSRVGCDGAALGRPGRSAGSSSHCVYLQTAYCLPSHHNISCMKVGTLCNGVRDRTEECRPQARGSQHPLQ